MTSQVGDVEAEPNWVIKQEYNLIHVP